MKILFNFNLVKHNKLDWLNARQFLTQSGRRQAAYKKVKEQSLGASRDTISRTNDVFAGVPNKTRKALKCIIEIPSLFCLPIWGPILSL